MVNKTFINRANITNICTNIDTDIYIRKPYHYTDITDMPISVPIPIGTSLICVSVYNCLPLVAIERDHVTVSN